MKIQPNWIQGEAKGRAELNILSVSVYDKIIKIKEIGKQLTVTDENF